MKRFKENSHYSTTIPITLFQFDTSKFTQPKS
jgi:hypothetical protein